MTNRTKGILAITASALGFAIMAALVRLADDAGTPLSSIQKSFFRNVVALTIASFVLLRKLSFSASNLKKSLFAVVRSKTVFKTLLLRSTLGTCGIFANFYALGRIPIAEGQTLNKTAPFFTLIFARLFLAERATPAQIAALFIAFIGVLFVAKPGFAGEAAFPLAVGLAGGVFAGGAYACVRALRRLGSDPAIIVAVFSAFSCAASVPFIIGDFTPMTWAQVAILLGAGAGASAGQFGITLAYGYAAPREIAVWDYSSIVFAAALGFVLFGQMPDALSIAGFALIVIAARTVSRNDDKGAKRG